jgi:peptidyl-prolyl cis-trans isomerase A (cyclophilin A)
VANFVGLAEGTKEFTDPVSKTKKKARYYDGTTLHRTVPNFMIQGGDPTGTGRGEPGFTFKNEYTQGIEFDRPGRLAMANRGRDTNGSQFFITEINTSLSAKDYTIFGQCAEGLELVTKIANAPRTGEAPITPVKVEKVTIERVK